MNCHIGDLMKVILQLWHKVPLMHFHIMYAYSWSFIFFHMCTTSNMLTLAILSRVPISNTVYYGAQDPKNLKRYMPMGLIIHAKLVKLT